MARGAITPALSRTADDIFEGQHLPISVRPLAPEVRLARAVLWRAWDDAFLASDYFLVQSERKAADAGVLRAEARRFLTLGFGQWREDREFWCDVAEVPESTLRKVAKRRLELAKDEERTATVIALDRAFAALVADADNMPTEALDAALTELAALESAAA